MCGKPFYLGTPIRVADECLIPGVWYVAQCCAFKGAPQCLPTAGD